MIYVVVNDESARCNIFELRCKSRYFVLKDQMGGLMIVNGLTFATFLPLHLLFARNIEHYVLYFRAAYVAKKICAVLRSKVNSL